MNRSKTQMSRLRVFSPEVGTKMSKVGGTHEKDSRVFMDDKEKKRCVALAVGLMDATAERVGNSTSADDGHFGVTGLRVRHLTVGKDSVTIRYVGKSGVKQEKVVDDPFLIKALKEAVKGKGKDDEICGGITAEDVNEYLKPFGVTAKDIRGFHANTDLQTRLKAIRSKGGKLPTDKKDREKKLKDEFKKALGETAEAVGHEVATLSDQYLVPGLEDEYLRDGTVTEKLIKKSHILTTDEVRERYRQAYGVRDPAEVMREILMQQDRDCRGISKEGMVRVRMLKTAVIDINNATDGLESELELRGDVGLLSSLTYYEKAVMQDRNIREQPILKTPDGYTLCGRKLDKMAVVELIGAGYLEDCGDIVEPSGLYEAKLKLYRSASQHDIHQDPFRWCPVCGAFYSMQTRCTPSTFECPNGHKWVWCNVHNRHVIIPEESSCRGPRTGCRCGMGQPIDNPAPRESIQVAEARSEESATLAEKLMGQIVQGFMSRQASTGDRLPRLYERHVPSEDRSAEHYKEWLVGLDKGKSGIEKLWDFVGEQNARVAVGKRMIVSQPPFEISYLPQYAEIIPDVQKGLARVAAMYQKAGIRLAGRIPILVMGRQGGGQRSFYMPSGGGYIQLIPGRMTSPEALATMIHEVAHFVHNHFLSGGFRNAAVWTKWTELKSGGLPKDTGGTPWDVLNARQKFLGKELLALGRRVVHPGMTYEEKGQEDPWKGGPSNYVRKFRVDKVLRGDDIQVEILNPSDADKRVDRQGAGRYFRLESVLRMAWKLSPEYKAKKEEESAVIQQMNDIATGKSPSGGETGRYENVTMISDWFPTPYSKKNSKEWFAELLSVMVVAPRLLSEPVQGWLLSVLHGTRIKVATLTPLEREDDEAERLIRPEPKKKPPRNDLRRERMDPDPDKDTENTGADKDQDLSLNFKRVASKWTREVLAGSPKIRRRKGKPPGIQKLKGVQPIPKATDPQKPASPAGGAPAEKKEEEHKPGDVWQSDKGWVGKNPEGVPHTFKEKEPAQAYAKGKMEDVAPEKGKEEDQGAEAEAEKLVDDLNDVMSFKKLVSEGGVDELKKRLEILNQKLEESGREPLDPYLTVLGAVEQYHKAQTDERRTFLEKYIDTSLSQHRQKLNSLVKELGEPKKEPEKEVPEEEAEKEPKKEVPKEAPEEVGKDEKEPAEEKEPEKPAPEDESVDMEHEPKLPELADTLSALQGLAEVMEKGKSKEIADGRKNLLKSVPKEHQGEVQGLLDSYDKANTAFNKAVLHVQALPKKDQADGLAAVDAAEAARAKAVENIKNFRPKAKEPEKKAPGEKPKEEAPAEKPKEAPAEKPKEAPEPADESKEETPAAAPPPEAPEPAKGKKEKKEKKGPDPGTPTGRMQIRFSDLDKRLRPGRDSKETSKAETGELESKFLKLTPEGQERAADAFESQMQSWNGKASQGITQEMIMMAKGASAAVDRTGLTAEGMGEAAANLMFAMDHVANPTAALGVNDTDESNLKKFGTDAYDHYGGLNETLRHEAYRQLGEQLSEAEEGSPRHQQLRKVLEGLHLASIASGDDPKTRKVGDSRLQPEPSDSFKGLIGALDKGGIPIASLMDDDFYSPKGRKNLREHMKSLDDDDLTDLFAGPKSEFSRFMKSAMKGLKEPWQRDALRQLMGELVLEDMTTIHAVLQGGGAEKTDKGKHGPDEETTDMDTRVAKFHSDIRGGEDSPFGKAGQTMLDCLNNHADDPDGPDKCQKVGDKAKLDAIRDSLGMLKDYGIDIKTTKDPTIRKWQQAIKMGDVTELDKTYQVEGKKPPSFWERLWNKKKPEPKEDTGEGEKEEGEEEEEHKPGDVWQSDKGWVGMNPEGVPHTFEEKGDAEVYAKGRPSSKSPDEDDLGIDWDKFLTDEDSETEQRGKTGALLGDPAFFRWNLYNDRIKDKGRSAPSCPSRLATRRLSMAQMTKKGALGVTGALDRMATLFQQDHQTLGVGKKLALDFAKRCDLLADFIEKSAGINPRNKKALTGDDAVKEQGFNPEEIGAETAGPLEKEPDEPYMGGEFTQQENRELRERVEDGDLGVDPNPDPQPPTAGRQASYETLGRDVLAGNLGHFGKELQVAALQHAASDPKLATSLNRLAMATLSTQVGVAMGKTAAAGAYRVAKAVREVIPHVAGSVSAENRTKVAQLIALATKLAELPPEFLKNIEKKKEEGKKNDEKEEKEEGKKNDEKDEKDEKEGSRKASYGFNLFA